MIAPTTKAKVLLIDDEAQIRRFLGIALQSEGYQVVDAVDGADGLAKAAVQSPDLVILDLGLPDRDGKEVLGELRRWSTAPIIVLSVRSHEAEKVAALDLGANDYMTKPFGVQELLARLRALLRHRPDDDAPMPMFDDGHLHIDLARRIITLSGEPVALSRKEFALLALLLRHRGRVVTQQHLLTELWGPLHKQDTHYLRILVRKLRAKLGDSATEARYVQTEPGVGLRFCA